MKTYRVGQNRWKPLTFQSDRQHVWLGSETRPLLMSTWALTVFWLRPRRVGGAQNSLLFGEDRRWASDARAPGLELPTRAASGEGRCCPLGCRI